MLFEILNGPKKQLKLMHSQMNYIKKENDNDCWMNVSEIKQSPLSSYYLLRSHCVSSRTRHCLVLANVFFLFNIRTFYLFSLIERYCLPCIIGFHWIHFISNHGYSVSIVVIRCLLYFSDFYSRHN